MFFDILLKTPSKTQQGKQKVENMAVVNAAPSLAVKSSAFGSHKQHLPSFGCCFTKNEAASRRLSYRVRAAKLPAGMVKPKVEPKFQPPVIGFTRIAETWNSRACMMGLIGTFIVELILNKGILQLIGVEIGKGLDLPL